MTIPVVIGAMILGPAGGAVLGLVFGLTSFYQCFAGDPFWSSFGSNESVLSLSWYASLPEL